MKKNLIENEIKKMNSLMEYSLGQTVNEIETLGDIEKVSVKWLQNTANLIKKGKTLKDDSLKRMGRESVILAYFPMAHPDWKPKMKDIKAYINSSAPKQKEIIQKVNTELQKRDGTTLVSSRKSIKVGELDVGLTEFDLGYLNFKYSVVLNKARLKGYSNNAFSGFVDVDGKGNVPDGIFKGASINLDASSNFTIGYNGKISNENIILNFYPNKISVSTNWIGVNSKSVNLPSWVKGALSVLPGGLLTYTLQFKLSSNNIWVKLRAFGKDWFKTSIGTIDVTSRVKEKLKDVRVTLPLNVIRSQKIPNTIKEYEVLANNVAGGIKVEKNKG